MCHNVRFQVMSHTLQAMNLCYPCVLPWQLKENTCNTVCTFRALFAEENLQQDINTMQSTFFFFSSKLFEAQVLTEQRQALFLCTLPFKLIFTWFQDTFGSALVVFLCWWENYEHDQSRCWDSMRARREWVDTAEAGVNKKNSSRFTGPWREHGINLMFFHTDVILWARFNRM